MKTLSPSRRRATLFVCLTTICSTGPVGGPWAGQSEEPPSPTRPPSVLLIVSEDNGPELGCYGDPHARTPNIDALAAEGVRFRSAFVPYSVCSPSRASLFTGLVPHRNGQIGLATHRFAMYREWPNLVAELHGAGYRTGIIGKIHVNPESAFPCDFRFTHGKATTFGGRDVRRVADAAARFLEESRAQPFFLMVNYPDAHFPLLAQDTGLPERPLTGDEVEALPWVGADSARLREFTANYYNCLERLDAGVGMLLEELAASGRARETIVVYLGDHGAQFSRGKTSVHDAGLKIPLLMRWPGMSEAGLVREELVSTLDLFPTLLEAAGLPILEHLDGHSLAPLLRAGEAPADWRRQLFAMTTGSAPTLYFPQFSVRDERWRLILSPLRGRENACASAYLSQYNVHFAAGTTAEEIAESSELVRAAYARYSRPPEVELYDTLQDPYEWRDLAHDPEYAEVRARLEATLRAWRSESRDPWLDPEALARLTREHDAALTKDYRKDADFRWEYLTDTAPAQAKTENEKE